MNRLNTINIHRFMYKPSIIGFTFVFALAIATGLVFSYKSIVIFLLIAFLALGILQPKIFLLLLFAIRPVIDQFAGTYFYIIGPIKLNIQGMIGGGVIFVSVFYFLSHRGMGLKIKFMLPAILFLIEALVGVFLSHTVIVSLSDWMRIASWMLLIPFVASVFFSEKASQQLIKSCVIGAVVSAFIVLIGPTMDLYGLGERGGWFYSVHNAALFMVAASPFVLLKIFRPNVSRRAVYIFIEVALFVAIFFTYVRSALLAVLCQIGVIIFLMRKEKSVKFLSIIFLLTFFILISMHLPELTRRWNDLSYINSYCYRNAGAGRVGLWIDNIHAFSKAPLSEQLLGKGFRASIFVTEGRYGGHNDAVDVLSNNGLIGLGLYGWFLVNIFTFGKLLLRLRRKDSISCLFWAVILSYLVVALINGMLFNTGAMWYIAGFIGIAHAKLRYRNG